MSLIEAMVAAAILLIVLSSAAGSISLGFSMIAERRFRAAAEAVAASHMEVLVATAKDQFLGAADCAPVTYTRDVVAGGTVFTASCRLETNRPVVAVADRFSRLTVDVKYQHLGRAHSTSFSTYIENEP